MITPASPTYGGGKMSEADQILESQAKNRARAAVEREQCLGQLVDGFVAKMHKSHGSGEFRYCLTDLFDAMRPPHCNMAYVPCNVIDVAEGTSKRLGPKFRYKIGPSSTNECIFWELT